MVGCPVFRFERGMCPRSRVFGGSSGRPSEFPSGRRSSARGPRPSGEPVRPLLIDGGRRRQSVSADHARGWTRHVTDRAGQPRPSTRSPVSRVPWPRGAGVARGSRHERLLD